MIRQLSTILFVFRLRLQFAEHHDTKETGKMVVWLQQGGNTNHQQRYHDGGSHTSCIGFERAWVVHGHAHALRREVVGVGVSI